MNLIYWLYFGSDKKEFAIVQKPCPSFISLRRFGKGKKPSGARMEKNYDTQ